MFECGSRIKWTRLTQQYLGSPSLPPASNLIALPSQKDHRDFSGHQRISPAGETSVGKLHPSPGLAGSYREGRRAPLPRLGPDGYQKVIREIYSTIKTVTQR